MGGADPISPALERVLGRLAGMVRRVGLRHGLPAADVDDLVQEVRIRLWRALQTGERIAAAPASYVYRTAASAALDLIRRRRARREDPGGGAAADSPAATAARPDHQIEATELVDRIALAIDSLAESRRPVVRMYLAGYRLEEIADLLEWSEAKTRNLLYRGLADLRGRLTEMGIGPEATG